MKNRLSSATRNRLAFALALSAASLLGVAAPVRQAGATAIPHQCPQNYNTYIVYYSDPAKTHPICQEAFSCYNGTETNYCPSGHTNYWTIICGGLCSPA